MIELTFDDTEEVGGGLSILSWILQQAAREAVKWVFNAAISGQIDYSSIAESQGHYYNMTGA